MTQPAPDTRDAWFAASPLPLFETQLPALSGVLGDIRRRIGVTDDVGLLTPEEVEAIRTAHNGIGLVRVNRAFLTYFQVTEAQLPSRWPSILASAMATGLDASHMRQLVSGQPSTQWTAEWSLPDGSWRAAKIVSSPLPGRGRDLMGVTNTVMDVTEHRREARLFFEDNPTPTAEFDSTAIVEAALAVSRQGGSDADLRAVVADKFAELRCLRVNAAAARFFQRSIPEFVAKPQVILNQEALTASVNAIVESLAHGAAQRPYIAPIVRADGSIRYAFHRSRAIGPLDRPWARTQVSYTDVTATRVAEITAQASMAAAWVEAERQRVRWERSASLANAACFELNIKERAYLPSSSLEALLGVSIETLNATGSMFLPMVPEPWKSQLRKRYLAAVASGEQMEFEHPLDRLDGQRIWLQSSFVVETDEAGDRTTGFGYMQNITARKTLEEKALSAVEQAEAALAGKREMLAAFLDEPDTLEEAGETAGALSVTEARDLAGLLARQLSVLHEINDRDKMLSRAMKALDEARLRAEAANVAKSQFLAVMSHELRTPLNAVIGYTELLEDEWGGQNPATAGDLGRIKGAAHHLLALITEILDFAKIDAGKMELALEPADLANVLAAAADLVRPMAEAKGLAFHVDIAPTLGGSLIDVKRVKQCIVNLLSNAQKFTSVGGVSLTARRIVHLGGDELEVVVRDTGCGIAAEHLVHLFEPFRQVDASLSRRHEGTGLGLAITRKLARLMDGDLIAQSSVESGSSFTMTIRLAPTQPAAVAA